MAKRVRWRRSAPDDIGYYFDVTEVIPGWPAASSLQRACLSTPFSFKPRDELPARCAGVPEDTHPSVAYLHRVPVLRQRSSIGIEARVKGPVMSTVALTVVDASIPQQVGWTLLWSSHRSRGETPDLTNDRLAKALRLNRVSSPGNLVSYSGAHIATT